VQDVVRLWMFDLSKPISLEVIIGSIVVIAIIIGIGLGLVHYYKHKESK